MTSTEYEQIVSHCGSPCLVLAGPGAGKTHLLADRAKRLLDQGIPADSITVLTFGTDASQHMRDTLVDPTGHFRLTPEQLRGRISTMHSLGLKIVTENPRTVGLRKADLKVQHDETVKQLLYRDAALLLGLTEHDADEARQCKQRGECKQLDTQSKCRTCRQYWSIMSKCNYIDFDDQILFACRVMDNKPAIRDKYQSSAAHLLVDEYQDINAAQFRLIELLSRQARDGLFVVGDDAQSIYGFRGADTQFILRFAQDYPGAASATLRCSRRCPQVILEDAFRVLATYYKRWNRPRALEYLVEDAEPPHVWHMPSDVAEARRAAAIARTSIDEGKTVLILAPKKQFFPRIVDELIKRGVPYSAAVSFLPPRIKVAKLFVDWLDNPSDSFLTRLVIERLMTGGIAHVPGAEKDRRSSPATIKKRVAQETAIARLWESVDKNHDLLSVINHEAKPTPTLRTIRDSLRELRTAYADDSGATDGEFAKQLARVSGVWGRGALLADDIATVAQLLEREQPAGPGTVQLKTMRKAKGLGAQVVIIVGLEDDIVPSPGSDLPEEARLFYVSMTRASEKVYLLHAFKRPRDISYGPEIMRKARSRFLDALGRPSEWQRSKRKH